MEYHLQAIDELSIPDDSDVDNVDHVDVVLPVTSKTSGSYRELAQCDTLIVIFDRGNHCHQQTV